MKQSILFLSLVLVLMSCKQPVASTVETSAKKTEVTQQAASATKKGQAIVDETAQTALQKKAADLVKTAEKSEPEVAISKEDIVTPAAVGQMEKAKVKKATVKEALPVKTSEEPAVSPSKPAVVSSTPKVEKAEEDIVYNEKPPRIPEKVEKVTIGKPKDKVTTTSAPPPPPVAISHAKFDELLSQYVSAGKVDYKGIKSKVAKLDEYLAQLENTDVTSLGKKEKLAFWINAYNAFTIKKIVDNYPLASITDLDGGKPWDVKWIKLNNKTLSLNNIENDIIRPTFKEPRIHFAVNCAAKSCPPILNKAWTAANLESNFEKQTLAFINDSSYNDIKADSPKVSKIFEWYAADFGDLISYLNKYSKTKISSSAKVEYMEYDWKLNN